MERVNLRKMSWECYRWRVGVRPCVRYTFDRCVCSFICVHVCSCVCIFANVCVWMCIFVACMCVYVLHGDGQVCILMCECVNVCVARVYKCVNVYMYVCMYICADVCHMCVYVLHICVYVEVCGWETFICSVLPGLWQQVLLELLFLSFYMAFLGIAVSSDMALCPSVAAGS